jgi:histidinol phosphate phosphatase hisN-like protein
MSSPLPRSALDAARDALVANGITGPHQSHPRVDNLSKIHKLVDGNPGMSFGMSGMTTYSVARVLGFVSEITGCSPDPSDDSVEDAIDPERTLAGIIRAARHLVDLAHRGAGVVFATGHPTGVLLHDLRVSDAYHRAGGEVLRAGAERSFPFEDGDARICYVGGVGCLARGSSLQHTHSAVAMDAALDSGPLPDAVFADHGFAGAAIERGIPTIAIMDINDPALAVAVGKGKDVVVIPMDDNRPPHLYEPSWRIFEEILCGAP